MKYSFVKNLCALCFFLTVSAPLFSQWQWLSPGYTNAGNYAQSNYGVAVDPNGGVYTTGYYLDNSNYDFKITLRKFAADGKLAYFKLINNGTAADALEVGNDIGVSLANNVVVIGGMKHGGIPYLGFFRTDNGNSTLISQVAFTGYGEITKLDVQGNFVYVIGNFSTTLSLGSGAPTYVGNGLPHGNLFVAKYNLQTGAYVSSMYIKSGYSRAYDIKADPSGNVYFTAGAWQAANFYNSANANIFVHNPVSTQTEVFACKLNGSLAVSWTKTLPATVGAYDTNGRFPLSFISGILVAGGNNTPGAFLHRLVASNGSVQFQTNNIANRIITDLVAVGCSQSVQVVGTNTSGGNNKLFLDKYNFSNLSFASSQSSNPTASGVALVADDAGRPIATGNYSGGVYTINGQSINVANPKGTVTGLYIEPSNCCSNRGLILDGTDDYVSAAYMPLSGNMNFTFEAWVWSTETTVGNCATNFRRLLGWGTAGGQQIEIGDCDGFLKVNFCNPGVISISNSTAAANIRGGWKHVAVTRNGPTLTAYVNGVSIGSASVGGINIANTSFFNIGQKAAAVGSANENWKGRIDEVRLWNYARPANLIQSKKDCSLRGNENGLILYYALDHGIPGGTNTGVNIAWNYASSISLWGNLNNFALSGALSNWMCSSTVGLSMNGICTPFAPEPGDEREEESLVNEEAGSEKSLKLFPNPNNGLFNAQLLEPASADLSLRILSLAGQVLREQVAEAATTTQRIDATDLPAGLYFLQVVADGKVVAMEKFVKQ